MDAPIPIRDVLAELAQRPELSRLGQMLSDTEKPVTA